MRRTVRRAESVAGFVIAAISILAVVSCAPEKLPPSAPGGKAAGSPEAPASGAPASAAPERAKAQELALWAPPAKAKAGALTVETLVAEGNREGLRMENPFELDPDIEREVDRDIGPVGSPMDRMRRITRFLNDKGYINFQYTPDLSLTAKEAFHARKGDCMAYTNLYMGIARHLRIPAYFVHVTETRDYYEREGLFFISSHMAVAYGGEVVGRGIGLYTMVVDFTVETTDVGLQVYRSIDDPWAVALFYNNVAVDHLMKGDPAYSEQLLKFLIAKLPGVRELYNNLSVVLMREGQYEEALAVLQRGIARFPGYHPLYTNAVQAALACRDPKTAEKIKADGEKWTKKDPFYLFNQGVEEYRAKDFASAADLFGRALKIRSNNPIILFWLARAHLSGGQTDQGLADFSRGQELAPNHPMIPLMRAEFPLLANVPSVMVVPGTELSPPPVESPKQPRTSLPALP